MQTLEVFELAIVMFYLVYFGLMIHALGLEEYFACSTPRRLRRVLPERYQPVVRVVARRRCLAA